MLKAWNGLALEPSLAYAVGRKAVFQPGRAKWGISALGEAAAGLDTSLLIDLIGWRLAVILRVASFFVDVAAAEDLGVGVAAVFW